MAAVHRTCCRPGCTQCCVIRQRAPIPTVSADPPDTVKARLQVQGAGGAGVLYQGTLDAFAKIAAREVRCSGDDRLAGCLLLLVDRNENPASSAVPGFWHGVVDLFNRAPLLLLQGVPGFYRGFGGILLTVIPANCCYFRWAASSFDANFIRMWTMQVSPSQPHNIAHQPAVSMTLVWTTTLAAAMSLANGLPPPPPAWQPT